MASAWEPPLGLEDEAERLQTAGLTALRPLLAWKTRQNGSRPPVWARSHAHGTDAVVFPVVWYFSGPRRASTVAFPVYWRFRRAHRDTRVVFPVYWDFVRGLRRATVAVNTIYIRDKVKKTYDFHFLPLVRVQRKRPADFKISFLAGLFGYERIGANRFLKLLLIPIELKRKAARTAAANRHARITEI